MRLRTKSSSNESPRALTRPRSVVLAHGTLCDMCHPLLAPQPRVVEPQHRDMGEVGGEVFQTVDITQNASDCDGLHGNGRWIWKRSQGIGGVFLGHLVRVASSG